MRVINCFVLLVFTLFIGCINLPHPKWNNYKENYSSPTVANTRAKNVQVLVTFRRFQSNTFGEHYFGHGGVEHQPRFIFSGFLKSGLFKQVLIGPGKKVVEPDFLVEVYVRVRHDVSIIKNYACILGTLGTIGNVSDVSIMIKSRIYDKRGRFRGEFSGKRSFTDYNHSNVYYKVYRDLMKEILLKAHQKSIFNK